MLDWSLLLYKVEPSQVPGARNKEAPAERLGYQLTHAPLEEQASPDEYEPAHEKR